MKKIKYRRLAAMAASLLCCLIFTAPAYAQSSEPQPETAPAPAETEAEPETQNPFTPDGTGTVVDNATDEDGKEFYIITTADESVFYLVIDKQKTSENVYFLCDLLQLPVLIFAVIIFQIRELEKQKQEEENSQIVQAVRSLKLTPAQLMAFLNDPKNSLTASGHTDPKPEEPGKEDTAHEEN